MTNKDEWTVVKFVIAATGLRRQDARDTLASLPKDTKQHLFLVAKAWNQKANFEAASQFAQLTQDIQVASLVTDGRRGQMVTRTQRRQHARAASTRTTLIPPSLEIPVMQPPPAPPRHRGARH